MIDGSKNIDWHKHEKRIKNQLNQYFIKKGYSVSFNRGYDTFDVIVAKTNDDLNVEELIGIEIKSDKDNIMRIKDQLIRYIRIFDKIYLALEHKEVPEFIPPFIGIIRCNSHVEIQREAQNIYSGADFGFTINYQAIKNTIKESDGIKSRSKELMAYLNCLEDIKRKLLYNSLFYDNQIPFSKRKKKPLHSLIKITKK